MQSNMDTVTISDLMHFRNHKRAPHHSSVWRYSPGKCFAVPPALSFPRASCVCGSRAALVRWALSARGVSAGGAGRLMVTSRAGWPGASVCHPRALWAQSDKSVGTGSSPRMRSCTWGSPTPTSSACPTTPLQRKNKALSYLLSDLHNTRRYCKKYHKQERSLPGEGG